MRGKLKKSNILLIIAISILTVLVFGSIPSNATDHGKNVNAKMENIKMNDTFETIKKNVITYFKGVKTEWGKITWPEKHQVVVETFFVVAIVFIFTVFIYFVDVIFNMLLSKF